MRLVDTLTADAPRVLPPPTRAEPLGLYVHVPFCETKCAYCSFNSIPSEGGLHEAFVEAVCREIREAPGRRLPGGARGASPADTVFFGGGTPSLLTPAQLARVLAACRETFAVAPDAEVSIECNPGTVDRAALEGMRERGFNRVSFGAQSFDDAELRAIGRIHAARDIGAGVDAARAAGFGNVSLDLIFALPGQTMERWRANLRAAIDLGVDHLSCYMLQFDPGTPMTAAMLRGEVRPLDDELQKEMLLAAIDALAGAGYEPYEISNYAKPGFACRHNVKYWSGAPYLGFGPGAHSFIPSEPRAEGRVGGFLPRTRNPKLETRNPKLPWGVRWSILAGIEDYIRRVTAGEPVVAMREELTRGQRMFETVFLGLRMSRGLDLAAFARAFGVPFERVHGRTARRWIDRGFLERLDGFLRLSRRGLPFADLVMADFAP